MPEPREPLEAHFRAALTAYSPVTGESAVPVDGLWQAYRAQAASRLLDFQARELRSRGLGYYTIGSAGHECNAYVAAALRPTDPALLHYRSGAFYLARAAQVPGIDGIRDILLSLTARRDDPISGGRHKVFGREELAIPPATSTIGSHLPRAVGIALAISRAAKLRVAGRWPADAVVTASIGDASANHATTLAGINAALYTAYQGLPMPLLIVCEDNGRGISVPTPSGWIESAYGARPGLHYLTARGDDPDELWAAAHEAVDHARAHRRPVFLHLRTVRFLGHAGSDAELGYRGPAEIQADYARDPLLATARRLVDAGESPALLLDEYDGLREHIDTVTDDVTVLPALTSADEVIAPLAPHDPDAVRDRVTTPPGGAARRRIFDEAPPESEGPLTLAGHINRALADILASYDGALVFGADVGRKGGVYGVTSRLQKRAGAVRVFDTLLDETSILGLGLGTAISGLLPIPEIQYFAYLHNALDQIRGEAATTQFFSEGRFANGMVVRVAGLGYQKGFGGHFHNDDSIAAICDIPGVVVAVPSRGDDASAMLRTLAAAAEVDGTVSIVVEPIALYHERDLFEPGDGQLLRPYPAPDDWDTAHVEIGAARPYVPDGSGLPDLTIVTFGNGVPMSLRVADRLNAEGFVVRVLDLRWIRPLPLDALLDEASEAPRILIADETRHSGGVSESVLAALADLEYDGAAARVCSEDSFVPLADAARLVLLSEETIELAARQMLGEPVRRMVIVPTGRHGASGPVRPLDEGEHDDA